MNGVNCVKPTIGERIGCKKSDCAAHQPVLFQSYDLLQIDLPKYFMAESSLDIGVRDIRDEQLAAYMKS